MKGLITSLITALAITSLQAQPNAAKPKLVVGVTVDQLSTELIEAYWELFGDNGFKKLWRNGLVYKDTEFNQSKVDRASAIATVNTGTIPYIHGIISSEWLDKSTRQPESSVYDRNYMGNYTSFSSSPSKLLCSTITDELTRESDGTAIIYSIAPTADAAILLAGHAANGVLWFNTETGKWCSSTYYINYPVWANRFNEGNSINYREGDLVWTPFLSPEKYLPTNSKYKEAFRYNLLTPNNGDRYKKVVESPIINHEIIKLVSDLFDQSEIGQDQITDFLQLAFYAGNINIPNNLNTVENQDTYVRLDHCISQLLAIIDKKVGLHNTLLYLTSTGYKKEIDEDKNYNIPQGEFYLNRSSALLNLYLAAKYGEGQYIEAYNDLQIYLNHQLIDKKNIELHQLQFDAAQFLLEISGIQNVYYSTDILLNSANADSEKNRIRNSYYKGRSGDIILEIQPGWKVYNNSNKVEQIVSYAAIQAPTIFLGRDFKSQIIYAPIKAEAIAPTIAKSIRIRAPNGAKHKPIN